MNILCNVPISISTLVTCDDYYTFFLETRHRRMLKFILRPTSVWQWCLLNQTWRYMLC